MLKKLEKERVEMEANKLKEAAERKTVSEGGHCLDFT